MNCEQALDRMLEAEPAELSGTHDSPLSRHLRACTPCAAVAQTLRAELDAVDGALNVFGRAGDASTAADAALVAARTDPGPPAGAEPSERRRAVRALRYWTPLAAAATLATVLFIGRGERDAARMPAAEVRAAPVVGVHPPADRSAAVLHTANPEITIVWLYEREGS